MSLRETLKSIVTNVEGAMAVIVMANDGIPIDEAVVEQSVYDIQLLSVEYATVLKEIRRAVDVIQAGSMEEVSISTSQTRVVVRVLNDELFVALILLHEGNFGKGRYLLKLKSIDILQELV